VSEARTRCKAKFAMEVILNQTVWLLIAVLPCSINKSSGAAVQLKLKASALLQHLQHALLLPPLWPLVAECCASTMRALLPKVRSSPRLLLNCLPVRVIARRLMQLAACA